MSLNVIQFPGRIPVWTFAERARKVRRDLGYTQEQMSVKLGVGLKAYSAWESGKNTPANLSEIAERFERASGVNRVWFLGWADGPQPPTSTVQSRRLAIVRPLHRADAMRPLELDAAC